MSQCDKKFWVNKLTQHLCIKSAGHLGDHVFVGIDNTTFTRSNQMVMENNFWVAQVHGLTIDLDVSEERYKNRSPTEWAYSQACAALGKHKSRADALEETLNYIIKGATDECLPEWVSLRAKQALGDEVEGEPTYEALVKTDDHKRKCLKWLESLADVNLPPDVSKFIDENMSELTGKVEGEPTVEYMLWLTEERAKINRMDFLPLCRRLGVPEEPAREFMFIGLSNIDFFTSGYYDEAMKNV